LCEKGDKLIEEEVGKVYKGKKITKGFAHPTTISPSSYVTPYTPLKSDPEEAGIVLKAGEIVKIQLGAQIDGFGAIVCDSIVVGKKEISGREADLLLACHYANELLLRLMLPPGLLASTEEEKKATAGKKPYTQSQIGHLLEKVVKSYKCNLVESTTSWQFGHNEIEGKKKIILAPGEGAPRGEGIPEIGEVWGVEMGVSLGTGKVKTVNNARTTLHRRTEVNYGLKRPSSRATLSEIVKRFGTFPFSVRQLEDERAGKIGIVESVRANLLRSYEVVADKDGEPVARLWNTIGKFYYHSFHGCHSSVEPIFARPVVLASFNHVDMLTTQFTTNEVGSEKNKNLMANNVTAITKNGVQRLAAPPTWNLDLLKTENKITDEEILKILEQPLSKPSAPKSKNKKKKKKPAAKKAADAEEAEESSDEE
jgi:curved DNA binding protein